MSKSASFVVVIFALANIGSATPAVKRALTTQATYTDTNSQTVTYQGCFYDGGNPRVLPVLVPNGYTNSANTVQACALACSTAGYTYSGVEYGAECYCSSATLTTLSSLTSSTSCTMACSGASGYTCGGGYAIQVYSQTLALPTGAVASYTDLRKQTVTYAGCYQDNSANSPTNRVLANKMVLPSTLVTVPICAQMCTFSGYTYAGLEYGQECWCGTALPSATIPTASCNMACTGTGASSTICGGGNALSIYSIGSPASTAVTLTQYYNYVTGSAPYSVTYNGCYADSTTDTATPPTNGGSRTLWGAKLSTAVSVETCVNLCTARGYTLAGLTYTSSSTISCLCDNYIRNAAATSTSCTQVITSNSRSEYIGTAGNIAIYNTGGPQISNMIGTFSTTNANTIAYKGCVVDAVGARILPYQITTSSSASMTPSVCVDACAVQGYPIAGVEFGAECWCGPSTVSLTYVADGQCLQACAGNSTLACGNGNRLATYGSTITNAIAFVSSASGYSLSGCYLDSTTSRTLRYQQNQISSSAMTVAGCVGVCAAQGYPYAGVEYASQCFCDSALTTSNNAPLSSTATCNMPCTGSALTLCGGGNAINVYYNSANKISTLQSYASTINGASVTYAYGACFSDPASSGASRLFSTQISTSTNTVQACLSAAAAAGYTWAGIEYGGECWVSTTAPASAQQTTEATCTMACKADALHYCGNGWTLSVYTTTGATYTLK